VKRGAPTLKITRVITIAIEWENRIIGIPYVSYEKLINNILLTI